MSNKILILGSGGREHALAWKFSQTMGTKNVYVIPGNAGIENSYPQEKTDFNNLKTFCEKHHIQTIFVGPEQPLSEGIVDFFKSSGIQVFGPDRQAAQLESSKIFAKRFMQKYGVSTADFQEFNHIDDAVNFIEEKQGNLVIKFDGLAGGKGVFVCSNLNEAKEALSELEAKYGKNVKFIIEERIDGDEISIIGFTDSHTIKTLLPSQDHKQLLEGDHGPNTGGMGAYCPVEVSGDILQAINLQIVQPTLKGIQAEQMNYKGVIYFGIMIKDKKPYLLEYNVRFGDPETEVLLPSLKTDLWQITKACLNGTLSGISLKFEPDYFVDVVLTSGGYPKQYEKGKEISGLNNLLAETLVFHAGTKKENDRILTNGGRVLNIVTKGKTLDEAIKKVYKEVEKVQFDDMNYRKDIGKRKNQYLK